MNFRDFCLLFAVMSKAPLQDRLKLLYCLHCEQLLQHNSAGSPSDEDAPSEPSKKEGREGGRE